LILVLGTSALLYLVTLSAQKFGVQYDDCIYVSTAKGLATGQGYRLISLPHEPPQTKYPPVFPLVLSFIWRAYPQFPENLISMMLLSVTATVSFLALTWTYLIRQAYAGKWQALVVIAFTAINARMLILATSVVSEMVYAFLSVVALYLAEKHEQEKKDWVSGTALGVVTGIALLTRSAGLSLLLAIGTYYVLRGQWKRILLPVGIAGIFAVGWAAWCYANQSTAEGVNAAYYTSYLRDFNEVINRAQAIGGESRLSILLSMVITNITGFILVSVPICLGLPLEYIPYFGFAFLFIIAGFYRLGSNGLRLVQIYLISYLAFHFVWPYVTYSRFLMPLLPFLLLFIITELDRLARFVRRELGSEEVTKKVSAVFIGLAALASASLALYYTGSDLYHSVSSSSSKKIPGPAVEDSEATAWIKQNTELSDVIICSRDPLYFLYTGRKATRSFAVNLAETVPFQKYRQATSEQNKLTLQIIADSNARYIVVTTSDLGYESDSQQTGLKTLLEENPARFIPVFRSSDERSKIFRVDKIAE
jgi:hypothetical protein